jgi:mannitol-1-phosphate 5-dehydrogenase
MSGKTLVGFGFGPIQSGLFVYEAYRSRNFERLVIAEIVPDLVDALRNSGGTYTINIATGTGIEHRVIEDVEIYNPRVPSDRDMLATAIAGATEIVTALPSVDFFGSGEKGDVVDILHRGLTLKADTSGPQAIIYTAENDNQAAGNLKQRLVAAATPLDETQCLNTVIGKMSGVVADTQRITDENLKPLTDTLSRAVLVEKFNRILISKIQLPGFVQGIDAFEEKLNLQPFEDAKLYGHNAAHALLGYLLWEKGDTFMADALDDPGLVSFVREAFVHESGAALCSKYRGIDPLFTDKELASHVDDLIERMLNPFLRDTVERVTRDPRRKLGWNDRLVGTMRMVLAGGIKPERFSQGAAAALRYLQQEDNRPGEVLLREIWNAAPESSSDVEAILALVLPPR